MRNFRNMVWLGVGVLITLAPPVIADAEPPPWAPLIGAWRTTDYDSCGVDDVRYGRITSIGKNSMLVGAVHCVIEDGAATDVGFTLSAECELGEGYYTRLAYDWRLTGPNEAVMTNEGYERRLVRCVGGVE